MDLIPIPREYFDLINEAVLIAYQNCEEEAMAELFKELMVALEEAEMQSSDYGSAQVVLGSKGRWRLQ